MSQKFPEQGVDIRSGGVHVHQEAGTNFSTTTLQGQVVTFPYPPSSINGIRLKNGNWFYYSHIQQGTYRSDETLFINEMGDDYNTIINSEHNNKKKILQETTDYYGTPFIPNYTMIEYMALSQEMPLPILLPFDNKGYFSRLINQLGTEEERAFALGFDFLKEKDGTLTQNLFSKRYVITNEDFFNLEKCPYTSFLVFNNQRDMDKSVVKKSFQRGTTIYILYNCNLRSELIRQWGHTYGLHEHPMSVGNNIMIKTTIGIQYIMMRLMKL